MRHLADQRLVGPTQNDALYTASILAVHAESGSLAWYFQTTPGDHWDFDAVQKLILADLKIDGADPSVIMQANKNGFFYIFDRQTGLRQGDLSGSQPGGAAASRKQTPGHTKSGHHARERCGLRHSQPVNYAGCQVQFFGQTQGCSKSTTNSPHSPETAKKPAGYGF